MLFLGFMAFLLLIAIVSGVVLYAPFMRKLRFGEVRRERTTRTKWLDLPNLLAIVTLVAFRGGRHRHDQHLGRPDGEVLAVRAVGDGGTVQRQTTLTQLGSLEAAVAAARLQEPGMKVGFIAFPGTTFSSPHHHGVFMRGNEALTSRLFKPVLVDAETAQVTDSRALPWYLTALLVSQPLHFGDYGGKPMQVIWAVLDVITIVLLGSGLYLWLAKRRQGSPRRAQASTGVREAS